MSKIIKPVQGFPVDLYLERLSDEVQAESLKNPASGPRMGRSPKEVRDITEMILRSANTGTCMNESQAEELRRAILYRKGADATLAEELIPRVNSFRLNCENCLQRDCSSRDPKSPVREGKRKP